MQAAHCSESRVSEQQMRGRDKATVQKRTPDTLGSRRATYDDEDVILLADGPFLWNVHDGNARAVGPRDLRKAWKIPWDQVEVEEDELKKQRRNQPPMNERDTSDVGGPLLLSRWINGSRCGPSGENPSFIQSILSERADFRHQ